MKAGFSPSPSGKESKSRGGYSELIKKYIDQTRRPLSQFKTLSSDTHSSIFEGFSLHQYINVRKLVCNNKHNQPCVVCSKMINVAQTVLDKGFLKLKTAFKMVSPDLTYTALHARTKLLQMPLVSLRIGD